MAIEDCRVSIHDKTLHIFDTVDQITGWFVLL